MAVLITGASKGIGREFARICAQNGHDCVLVARSQNQLEALQAELENTYHHTVDIIVCDLTTQEGVRTVAEKTKHMPIDILINNAGFGLKGDFIDTPLEMNTNMIQLNCTALMQLSHIFGNRFKEQGRGAILQVSSIVSFFPGPRQPVYYATKAFVRSFSYALAHNLKKHNVSVTILNPGVTKTQFFEQAQISEISHGDDPYKVALCGYTAMKQGKMEITYGAFNTFLVSMVVRFLPTWLTRNIIYWVSPA